MWVQGFGFWGLGPEYRVYGSGTPELPGMWVVLEIRVPFRVLFIRVPYYVGDPQKGPNLENFHVCSCALSQQGMFTDFPTHDH